MLRLRLSLLALAAVGCSACGPAAGGSGSPPSHASFVAAANAVCRQHARRIVALEQRLERTGNGGAGPGLVAGLHGSLRAARLVAGMERDLAAVAAPSGDRRARARTVALTLRAVRRIEAESQALLRSGAAARVDRASRELLAAGRGRPADGARTRRAMRSMRRATAVLERWSRRLVSVEGDIRDADATARGLGLDECASSKLAPR